MEVQRGPVKCEGFRHANNLQQLLQLPHMQHHLQTGNEDA